MNFSQKEAGLVKIGCVEFSELSEMDADGPTDGNGGQRL